jgi:hypothetical protein
MKSVAVKKKAALVEVTSARPRKPRSSVTHYALKRAKSIRLSKTEAIAKIIDEAQAIGELAAAGLRLKTLCNYASATPVSWIRAMYHASCTRRVCGRPYNTLRYLDTAGRAELERLVVMLHEHLPTQPTLDDLRATYRAYLMTMPAGAPKTAVADLDRALRVMLSIRADEDGQRLGNRLMKCKRCGGVHIVTPQSSLLCPEPRLRVLNRVARTTRGKMRNEPPTRRVS